MTSDSKNIDLSGTYQNTTDDAATPIVNKSSNGSLKNQGGNAGSDDRTRIGSRHYVSGVETKSSSSHQFQKGSGK